MEWKTKSIVGNAFKTVYGKGVKACLMLIFAVFLFSYIGIRAPLQTTFVNRIDHWVGIDYAPSASNVELLREYAANSGIVSSLPSFVSEYLLTIFDGCTRSFSWVIRFFTLNNVYYAQNLGEVIAALIMTAVISIVVRVFVMIWVNLGLYRYCMECRHDKNVPLRRLISPFQAGLKKNEFKVMFTRELVLLLWSFTIVGWFYYTYKYMMVPYLLAEDPSISWKEAKKLSSDMTDGYKFKIFKTHLSVFYLFIVLFVPFLGLITGLPTLTMLDTEIYFTLRARSDIDRSHFVEPLFDEDAYVVRKASGSLASSASSEAGALATRNTKLSSSEAGALATRNTELSSSEADAYVLKNVKFAPKLHVGHFTEYSLTDFIYMFFVFGIGGWIWECGLYVVRDHMIVNRGSLYGPWIPIYGFGGVLIVFLLDRFKDNKIRVFLIGTGISAVLEYFVSFMLEFVFNSSYWNYDEDFLNINGRICISGLTAFGIGGLAAVYLLAPTVSAFAEKLKPHTRKALAIGFCCLFFADLIFCIVFGFNSGEGISGNIAQ